MRPCRHPKKRRAGPPPSALPTATSSQSKPSNDVRKFQGIGNQRSSHQRAPRWSPPKGTDASLDLMAALNATKPFIVVCIRDAGGRRLYMRFPDWNQAFHCAAVLGAHGLAAEARDEREPRDEVQR